MINVAKILKWSQCNGHGTRFVVWMQGCKKRCPGCFNPENQSMAPNQMMEPEELIRQILSTKGIHGVTFSGGEPFLQAKELLPVATAIRNAGLTLLIFTGYSSAELQAMMSPDVHGLFREADMVIAGEYDASQPSDIPLVGSANQEIINVSNRLPHPKDDDIPRFEVIVTRDQGVIISGFPKQEEIDEIKSMFPCREV